MKRFITIACLVLLMVSFISCGKAPEAEEASEQPSTEITAEDTTAMEEAETMDTTAVEASEEQPTAEEAEE
jgi:hypothetical protein